MPLFALALFQVIVVIRAAGGVAIVSVFRDRAFLFRTFGYLSDQVHPGTLAAPRRAKSRSAVIAPATSQYLPQCADDTARLLGYKPLMASRLDPCLSRLPIDCPNEQ
jgi:hypothetical protein